MKVLLVGIDAASPRLIEKWIDKLPNLKNLERTGTHGVLTSIVPPSSVPAWQCLATGKNPAKIGVFGFSYIGRDRRLKQGRTTPELGCIWDLCSRKGLRVGVFNVPGTFPPYPLNGFMVSGFPTPPGKTWANPEDLMRRLDASVDGYEIDVPLTKPSELRGGEEEYLRQVERLHRKSLTAAKRLIEWYSPDVFIMTLQGVDMVQHDFWRYMDDLDSRYNNVLRDWYVKMDEAVGELKQLAGDESIVLVVSDHGAAPVSSSFYINEYLRRQGVLSLKAGSVKHRGEVYTQIRKLVLKGLPPNAIRAIYRLAPESMAYKLTGSAKIERTLNELIDNIDWDRTLAFSTGGHQAAIYVNGHRKMQNGGTLPHENSEIVERVCNLLSILNHPSTGESLRPVFHMRNDVFSGPYSDEAPDVCVELFKGEEKIQINPRVGVGRLWSFEPHFSAEHVREGFWAFSGPGLRQGLTLDARIVDIAPTLVRLLGLEATEDFDGKALEPVFEHDRQALN
jgi:predicted AlkP superfamily phosphohydrolase/phosphomutase